MIQEKIKSFRMNLGKVGGKRKSRKVMNKTKRRKLN